MNPSRNDTMQLVLVAAIVGIILVVFWNLLDVMIISVSLAVVLYPLHSYSSRSVNRYYSAALVTTLIFLLFIGTVALSFVIISQNSGTIREIVGMIMGWVENPATDPRLFGLGVERQQVAGWFTQGEALFTRYWNTITSDTNIIALKTAIFFASLFLFLVWGAGIWDRIVERIPENLKGHFTTMSSVTVDTLFAIYVVHLGITALTFVIAIPFFIFLGYGHVLFFAFLCALCELIPVLGSSVVFLFLGIYALSMGDIIGVFVIFFIGYIGIAALPEIYVRPVLMGRRVRIHPIFMLVGFLGGVILIGMAGFVVGPVVIVLFFTGYTIMKNEKKKILSGNDKLAVR